jgi:hypothetical protein
MPSPGTRTCYLARVAHHWFTYPPFAAVLFTPLAAIPVTAARLTWELASAAAFVQACVQRSDSPATTYRQRPTDNNDCLDK